MTTTMAPPSVDDDRVRLALLHMLEDLQRERDALDASERKFKSLIEHASDLLVILDRDGTIAYISPSVGRIGGYGSDELRGRHYADFLHPEDAPAAAALVADLLAHPEILQSTQLRFLDKSGGWVVLESIARNALADPAIGGIVVNARDVSERTRAERATRASDRRLRSIVRNMPAGFTHCEMTEANGLRDFVFADVNPAFASLTGLEDVLGRTLSEVIPGVRESNPEIFEAMAKASSCGTPIRLDTYVAPLDIWVSITAYNAGKRQCIVVLDDITERKRHERALRLLNEANQMLIRADDEAALLNAMTRLIVSGGGYAMAWIGLVEHDAARTVRPAAYFGCDAAAIEHLQITWDDTERGRGPTGTAVRTGAIQLNRNTKTNPAMAPWREFEVRLGYGSSVAFPMKRGAGEDAFGVLNIYAGAPDAFDAEELKILEELANGAAYGIINLRTAREHTASVERVRTVMESAVETIAATLEARDPYTAGHQRRVAVLAGAIGRELGLDAETVRGLHFGSLIHDLGKIQIPAELLAKPSHLSPLEFEMIKTHAQAGHDIVKGIEFPWPVALMILQHHERLDGSGYPQGLTGDQIILEARILAVADTVEAMSSHRPYRPTRGIETTLAEIEDGRGTLYDAAAVDACVALFRNNGFMFADRTR